MPSDYSAKQKIQNSQYKEPYHWLSKKRVDSFRYQKLTQLIVKLICEIDTVNKSQNISICDFGCGDGRSAYLIWDSLNNDGIKSNIIGVDISEDAIEWARKMTRDLNTTGLDFIVGDIKTALLRLQETAGPIIIIMREVIEHLQETEIDKLISQIKDNAESGHIIVTTPSVNSPVEKKHIRHYSVQTLNNTMTRNGLKVTKILGFGFRPRLLYYPLMNLKRIFNTLPFVWRIMNRTWKVVSPDMAITLVCKSGFTK
jgi:2-polyprenyl-3-methyl-5-hydroxy-6-metoxy-1,4-benzoquinol methylase